MLDVFAVKTARIGDGNLQLVSSGRSASRCDASCLTDCGSGVPSHGKPWATWPENIASQFVIYKSD